jgi:hypothetical protein
VSQPYENVVFAGGGNRCVWQAGFYRTVAEGFALAPARVAAASAGAAVAAVFIRGASTRSRISSGHLRQSTQRALGQLVQRPGVSARGDVSARALRSSTMALLPRSSRLRLARTGTRAALAGACTAFVVAAFADACEHAVGPRAHLGSRRGSDFAPTI